MQNCTYTTIYFTYWYSKIKIQARATDKAHSYMIYTRSPKNLEEQIIAPKYKVLLHSERTLQMAQKAKTGTG